MSETGQEHTTWCMVYPMLHIHRAKDWIHDDKDIPHVT